MIFSVVFSGVGQDDPSDSDWYPPAKKARGVKRKSSVPTRIIKQEPTRPVGRRARAGRAAG